MSASQVLVGALLLGGALLVLVAAIGVVRFPDVYTRMSAASKTSTLGALLMLVAYGVAHADTGVDARALAAAAFLMLSASVGAHAIGRAAYRRGDPLFEGTEIDELAERGAAGERAVPQDGERGAPGRG
jgi:multicomponent Na+:H+ antiporter subunit G